MTDDDDDDPTPDGIPNTRYLLGLSGLALMVAGIVAAGIYIHKNKIS